MRESWDECLPYTQAHILAYHQRAKYEEAKTRAEEIKAMIPKAPRLGVKK